MAGLLALVMAPAAAWACTAAWMQIADHPGYVRTTISFTNGTISQSNVIAVDPGPSDGTAAVTVSRQAIHTQVAPRAAYGVSVRIKQDSRSRLRIDIRVPRGRFKYLSYAVVRGTTLTVDLWKSAPPSSAAEIHRGPGGCLTLSGMRTSSGAVTSTGREHNLVEHQFSVLLRGSDGRLLAQRPVTARGGRWSATLRYRASRWQFGTSEAADFSAKDGSLVCLVQQRVTLSAAGAGAAAVYVTDYASNAVAQYDLGMDGALRPKAPATLRAGTNPLGIAASPDGKNVYVTNNGDRNLSQYTVTAGGVLMPKSPATVADGTHPPGVAVSPDGKSVYVTDLYGGRVSQYGVGPGGALVPKTPAAVAAGQLPYGVAITPDGRSVYVADSGSNAISQYSVGPGGTLTPKSPATLPARGGPPESLVVSPDGTSLYVTNEGAVSQYTIGADGTLAAKTPATVSGGSTPHGLAVSPDGHSVYVTAGNRVYQYSVGRGGTLAPKSPASVAAGRNPLGVAISPDGKAVYAANNGDNTISQYTVGAGGRLTPKSPRAVRSAGAPWEIAVLPTGGK